MIHDMFEDEPIVKVEEIEIPEKKLGPFDFLNSINNNKPMEFGESEDAAYIPFLVNRGLSYFEDTIMVADAMNQKHYLSNSAQYNFLLNIVRPRKRYSKWFKRETDDDVILVKEHYGFSEKKARQALSVMTPAEVELLKQQKEKGGIYNDKRRREA